MSFYSKKAEKKFSLDGLPFDSYDRLNSILGNDEFPSKKRGRKRRKRGDLFSSVDANKIYNIKGHHRQVFNDEDARRVPLYKVLYPVFDQNEMIFGTSTSTGETPCRFSLDYCIGNKTSAKRHFKEKTKLRTTENGSVEFISSPMNTYIVVSESMELAYEYAKRFKSFIIYEGHTDELFFSVNSVLKPARQHDGSYFLDAETIANFWYDEEVMQGIKNRSNRNLDTKMFKFMSRNYHFVPRQQLSVGHFAVRNFTPKKVSFLRLNGETMNPFKHDYLKAK